MLLTSSKHFKKLQVYSNIVSTLKHSPHASENYCRPLKMFWWWPWQSQFLLTNTSSTYLFYFSYNTHYKPKLDRKLFYGRKSAMKDFFQECSSPYLKVVKHPIFNEYVHSTSTTTTERLSHWLTCDKSTLIGWMSMTHAGPLCDLWNNTMSTRHAPLFGENFCTFWWNICFSALL